MNARECLVIVSMSPLRPRVLRAFVPSGIQGRIAFHFVSAWEICFIRHNGSQRVFRTGMRDGSNVNASVFPSSP